MTRLKQCLRKDMVAMEEGLRLGHPADILLDTEQHRVAGLIVAKAKVPQLNVAVVARAVQSFDAENLPVTTLSAVKVSYQEPEIVKLIEKGVHMKGREVLFASGASFGRIVDAEIDNAGNVLQYFVRRSFLDRLLLRTHAIAPSELRTVGEEVAVAEPALEESVSEEETGRP